jgi:dephospho-CoA kinase
MGVVLGLTGQIASGKSTLAKGLATARRCERVSFGDYVRKTAEGLRYEPDRRTLQDLGQGLLDERGAEQFCIDVLKAQSETFVPGQDLVVDGVRHDTVADALASLVYPSTFALVFLRVDQRTRERRLELREGEDLQRLREADEHKTEVDVTRLLHRRATLTLVSTRPSGELVRVVCEWLVRERARLEGGT